MATVQDILYDARTLINQYNEDGVIIPSSDVAQQEANGIRLINMALQEVYKITRYFKVFTFTQNPTDEQLTARKWLMYQLPSDFATLEQVIIDDENRTVLSTYRLEEFNKLYLPTTLVGDFKVIYMPKLTRVVNMTDIIPNNNPIAEQFIVYTVASKLAMDDNPAATSFFEQTAKELKFEAMRKEPANFERITDIYFGTSYNHFM